MGSIDRVNEMRDTYELSVELGGYLLNVVGRSRGEVFHVGALAVEVGENYDFFLVVLAEILGNDHVVMRVVLVQLHDIVVPSEVVCDLALEGRAREASPEHLLPLYHRLIRLVDTPVEIQIAPLLGVGLELARELFLVVLLELLLDDADDCRDLVVLALAQQLVHLLVGVVSGVEVDEALEGSVLLLLFEALLGTVLLSVVGDLLQHEGHDVGGGHGILLDGLVDGLYVLFVLFAVGGGKPGDFRGVADGLAIAAHRQQHLFDLLLVEVDMRVHGDVLHDIALHLERVHRFALGLRDESHHLRLVCTPHRFITCKELLYSDFISKTCPSDPKSNLSNNYLPELLWFSH
jgi:hypothetical protein